jgi:hypothetical protein
MSQFDAFSPFGVFRFSSRKSPLRKVYEQMKEDLGPAFQGPVNDALVYAASVGLGLAQLQQEAAAAQDDPDRVTYLLSELEKDYQLYPSPTDSNNVRRAALKARIAIARGAFKANIESGLSAILGSDLITVRCRYGGTIDQCEFPGMWDDVPPYIAPQSSPRRFINLTNAVFVGAQTVQYVTKRSDGNPITVGDKLTVEPGKHGRHETVTVTSATQASFTATFTKSHEPGAPATTASFPYWGSWARHTLVRVKAPVLDNPTLLAKINEFMDGIKTTVSTWDIVTGDSSTFSTNETKFHMDTPKAIQHSVLQ